MKAVYRIAIVGTGPAGMYALEHLLHNKSITVEVDLFERLPIPWGLVRYGVAPDHPEKKLIANNLYSHLISRENVRFFGNVDVGKDISHEELSNWFDGVIYANGASSDNKLDIPGEDLNGSCSAKDFVAWYNGHPDQSHLQFDLSHKRAVIIGNGNVALDIARILSLPISALAKTDIAEHALTALRNSKITEIVILGRRGYTDGAFNNPELEEFHHIDGLEVEVDDPNFDLQTDSDSLNVDWQAKRKVKTLQGLVKRKANESSKRIIFKFLSSPLKITGNNKVETLRIAHKQIDFDKNGKQSLRSNGLESSINTGLILRAIGYRSEMFNGLPFDHKNKVIENQHGRVCENGKVIAGAYVTGWIKRGPKGVIGTNKRCSGETVNCLVEDLSSPEYKSKNVLKADEIIALLVTKQLNFVSYKGWQNIDRVEKENGRAQQRPRAKICDISKMLALAQG